MFIIKASKTLIPEIKILLKNTYENQCDTSAVSHTSIKYMIKIFESWCEYPFWGVANVSLLDLNAVRIINRTGKK